MRTHATGFGAIARGLLRPSRRELQARAPSSLEQLVREQQALADALRGFDLDAMDLPRDPSVHAAAESMTARLSDLGELRSALGAVLATARDPRLAPLVKADAPLSEYLRGVYSWCLGVLRAMGELANGLRALQPDWALFRVRLEDARAFHLEELGGAIQLESARMRLHLQHELCSADEDPLADLDRRLAELVWAAGHLGRTIEKRFG